MNEEYEAMEEFFAQVDQLSPLERLRGAVRFQGWLDWPDLNPADLEWLLDAYDELRFRMDGLEK